MRNLFILHLICFSLFIIVPEAGGNDATMSNKGTKSEQEKTDKDYIFLGWNLPITVIDMNIEFYKKSIPSQYVDAFLKATEARPDLRMILYAMMRVETHDFTAYESFQKNDNGSMDYGPLMLNSYNLSNEEFKKKYFPNETFWYGLELNCTEKEKTYNIYMVACINLFIAHMNTYNDGGPRWEQIMKSVKAYNAGPKVLRMTKGKKVRRANAYYQKVVANIESSKIAFNQMAEMYKSELDPRVFEVIW